MDQGLREVSDYQVGMTAFDYECLLSKNQLILSYSEEVEKFGRLLLSPNYF